MESGVRVLASYDDPSYRVELRADGILCYRASPGMGISLEVAQQLLADGLKLTHGPKPCLVLMQEIARVDREARAFFASDDYLSLASETALVVRSPVSRVIGNFFLGLNRPKYPIRLFTEVDAAVAWLREYVRD